MATVEEADAYFEKRLNTTAWDTADPTAKGKALAQAERELTSYSSRVDKTRFFYAVCEQALWLLTGDRRAQLQQAGVQGFSLSSISEQFDTKGRPPSIAPAAWPYLSGSGVKAGRLQ